MSRCRACDTRMNEFEMTRKYADSGEFVDLCNHCFSTIRDQVDVLERAEFENEIVEEDVDLEEKK